MLLFSWCLWVDFDAHPYRYRKMMKILKRCKFEMTCAFVDFCVKFRLGLLAANPLHARQTHASNTPA